LGLENPVIGIVGGNGRMGRWLTHLFRHRNYIVRIAGRNSETTPLEMARQSDVVVISVPIPVTKKVIREVGPAVREDGLLMDLTSVKKGPLDAMLYYSKCQVVGLHPLFGPESIENKGLGIAICPGRGDEGLSWISSILRDEGYRIINIDAGIHDRIMGIIQGVNHLSTLALAMTMRDSGFDLEDFENLSTVDFNGRLRRIKTMLDQPEGLFESIFMENQSMDENLEKNDTSAKTLRKIIKERDTVKFKDLYNELEKFFGIVHKDSYNHMDY
jgi:prephenate dehydrogenase